MLDNTLLYIHRHEQGITFGILESVKSHTKRKPLQVHAKTSLEIELKKNCAAVKRQGIANIECEEIRVKPSKLSPRFKASIS